VGKSRSEIDFAVEFGRYLATAAENFMAEHNRAAMAGEDPDPDYWRALASAIHEFRKRADRADALTNVVRRLAVIQRRKGSAR
jgi:hypothetical protein